MTIKILRAKPTRPPLARAGRVGCRAASCAARVPLPTDYRGPRSVPPSRQGRAGPRAQLLEPSLEVFELFDVLPLALPIDGPGIADHVGDGVFVAGEIAAVIEPIVEHAVEPV